MALCTSEQGQLEKKTEGGSAEGEKEKVGERTRLPPPLASALLRDARYVL